MTGEPRLSSESICEFAVNQLRRPNFHPFPPSPPRNVIFTETIKPRTRGPWASGRPPVSSDYFRDPVSSLTYFPDDRESFQAETKGLFLSRWRMGFLLGMINNVVSKLMKLTFAPGMCFGFFFFLHIHSKRRNRFYFCMVEARGPYFYFKSYFYFFRKKRKSKTKWIRRNVFQV